MACPYFMPVAKLENGCWPHPARLPLGGGWRGHCTAPGHEGESPAQSVLEAFCNLGYADSCAWAPRERSYDAVRFAVAVPSTAGSRGERDNRQEAARSIRLHYVCERDHLPAEHGELLFDLTTSAWTAAHHDPRLQKMAECFLDSYLQKKV